MRKVRLVRLLVLPVTVGLVITGLVYAYLDQLVPAGEQPAVVQVVVAAEPIPAKAQLGREKLALRPVPQEFAPPGAATAVEAVLGRITLVPLARGEVVLASKLASRDQPAGLAYRIPDGRRAMTVRVSEVIGVAGFPQPGDAVDVVATFTREVTGVDKTQLLLEDVPVLAVGQQTAVSEAQPRPETLTSLTLAVTPEQAVLLTLAEEVGRLRVLLRPVLGDRSRGRLEVTTGVFLDGGTAGLELEVRRKVALLVRLAEVDRAALGGLGVAPAAPGTDGAGLVTMKVASLSAAAAEYFEDLVRTGRARVLARADLEGLSRDRVRVSYLTRAPLYSRTGGVEVLNWLEYGVNLAVVPIVYEGDSVDLDVRPEVRAVDLVAAGAEAAPLVWTTEGTEPVVRLRTTAATVRLEPGQAAIVTGLVGPADFLTGPEFKTRHVLPEEYLTEAVRAGRRELVIVILPTVVSR